MPFAKVYDIRTVLVEHYATNGVFIDLFPIEGLPSEKHLSKYLKIQKKYCDNLYHLHDYKYGNYLEYDNSMPKTLVKLKYFIKHLFYYSKARTIKGLDSLYNSYQFDTAEYAGAICGAYGAKEHMDKNVFTNYISLEFEGRMYKCIAQYDAYLTKHYGDYMKLPPVDKQKASHHFKAYWKEYGINGAEY
jgi:lipopolysaccharide cholinephosphotransferase